MGMGGRRPKHESVRVREIATAAIADWGRRLRCADGQDSIEYVGALAVVAVVLAVVLGVVSDGLASALTRDARQGICAVFQSGCPAGGRYFSPDRGTGTRTGRPNQPSGPPIGPGLPVPVLPFPGTSASASRGSNDKIPGDEGGPKSPVSAKVQVVISRGNPTLKMTAAGCSELEQLGISTSLTVSASSGSGGGGGEGEGGGGEGGGEGEGSGGSVSVSVGVQGTVSYQLNVAPGEANKIRSGAAAPNPVDPRSLAPGDSIVLTEGTYAQLGLSGAYKVLQGQVNYTNGPQVTTGITALPGGKVRIYVGNGNMVQNAISAGVGNDYAGVSIGESDTQTQGKLHAVTIDLSSSSGWNAYQKFLHSGMLPSSTTAGVSDPITQQTYDDSQTITAEAHLFGFQVAKNWNPSDLTVTQTNAPGGSQTVTVSDREGGITMYESTTSGPGRQGSQTQYSLLLQNVDPTALYNFAQATGGSPPRSSSTQDVQLTFTPAQLNALQQEADAQIGASRRLAGEPPLTAQQVAAYVAKHPDQLPPGTRGQVDEGGMSTDALATARNPTQILQALQDGGRGSGSGELYALGGLQIDTAWMLHPKLHNLTPYLHPVAGQHTCVTPG
jgi:hypothetical protein